MEKLISASDEGAEFSKEWLEDFVALSLPEGIMPVVKGLKEKAVDTENPKQVVLDCIKRLEIIKLQREITSLQVQIQEVEKSGDMETLKHLAQEKMKLANRIKKCGVIWR